MAVPSWKDVQAFAADQDVKACLEMHRLTALHFAFMFAFVRPRGMLSGEWATRLPGPAQPDR